MNIRQEIDFFERMGGILELGSVLW